MQSQNTDKVPFNEEIDDDYSEFRGMYSEDQNRSRL